MPDLKPDEIRKAAIADELEARYERVKSFPEALPDGYTRLLELRQIVPDVLQELRRDLPKPDNSMQERFRFER